MAHSLLFLISHLTFVYAGVSFLHVFDLKDPIVGPLLVQDGEPRVGGVGDDAVGQDVPVTESNPRYLRKKKLFFEALVRFCKKIFIYVQTFVKPDNIGIPCYPLSVN